VADWFRHTHSVSWFPSFPVHTNGFGLKNIRLIRNSFIGKFGQFMYFCDIQIAPIFVKNNK
jgi:hypothetical protein